MIENCQLIIQHEVFSTYVFWFVPCIVFTMGGTGKVFGNNSLQTCAGNCVCTNNVFKMHNLHEKSIYMYIHMFGSIAELARIIDY